MVVVEGSKQKGQPRLLFFYPVPFAKKPVVTRLWLQKLPRAGKRRNRGKKILASKPTTMSSNRQYAQLAQQPQVQLQVQPSALPAPQLAGTFMDGTPTYYANAGYFSVGTVVKWLLWLAILGIALATLILVAIDDDDGGGGASSARASLFRVNSAASLSSDASGVFVNGTAAFSMGTAAPSRYCGQCFTTTMMAGQFYPSATVEVCNNETHLWIEIDPINGWCPTAIHLDVRLNCSLIPHNKAGNPQVGQFLYDYTAIPQPCSSPIVFMAQLNGAPVGTPLCIALHTDTFNAAQNNSQTSWAACSPFGGASWASKCTAFSVQGNCPTTPPPSTTPPPQTCMAFRTQTQGGWGGSCRGANPSCYLDANFATCFPNGINVGCDAEYHLSFTSAAQIESYLPATGTPSDIGLNANNALAGQALTLALNIGFDDCDANFSPCNASLGDALCLNTVDPIGSACNGYTPRQILKSINGMISSPCACTEEPGALPYLCNLGYSTLTTCADLINNNFDNGNTNLGNLVYCH